MRKILICCMTIILITGGCDFLNKEVDVSEMDPKDLPDVPAFQDEFTRGFMASTEEVEDGYYLFQSKTGGYTMMYPEDGKINPISYEKSNSRFESLRFGGDSEYITGATYSGRSIYESGKRADDAEVLFTVLSNMVGYKGDYTTSKYKNKTIYFATMKFAPKDMKGSTYRFFGVIKPNDSNQAVSYLYNIYCENEQTGCNYDVERIEAHVKTLMESIEFKHDE